MKSDSHDKLAFRLTQILVKLNQGQKLEQRALAKEFGVTQRTIQRDLNERFSYLPLEKQDGLYALPSAYLGKISLQDVENFACLAGVKGMFPALHGDFLRDIFDSRIQSVLMVKSHHYEDLRGKEQQFKQLEQAILSHCHISFDYRKTDGLKTYSSVQPYKLINHDGIWYLAARDQGRLKAYSFSKISGLSLSGQTFEPDPGVGKTLAEEDDIWLNPDKTEIVLKISHEVASYFKRRKLIAEQVIEKELDNGDLIVSCRVAHSIQILSVVRYWLPHVRIISPVEMQQELRQQLLDYLQEEAG